MLDDLDEFIVKRSKVGDCPLIDSTCLTIRASQQVRVIDLPYVSACSSNHMCVDFLSHDTASSDILKIAKCHL
jgi:hypothetical protein